MAGRKKGNIKVQQKKSSNNGLTIILGAAIVLIVVFFVAKGFTGGSGKTVSTGGDLVIPKSEISETARFYPYKAGGVNMEVVAVKASDGTIRTAFNTCQVCFNSGRGYYKQEGDVLVCQNCGNRFKMDQVEKIKGGCNPAPIMQENKTENGDNIVISKDFLAQNKDLFANWKQ